MALDVTVNTGNAPTLQDISDSFFIFSFVLTEPVSTGDNLDWSWRSSDTIHSAGFALSITVTESSAPGEPIRVRSNVNEDSVFVYAQRFTIGDGTSTIFTIDRDIPVQATGYEVYFKGGDPLTSSSVMKYILDVNVFDLSNNIVNDYSTSEDASEYVLTFDTAPAPDSRVVTIKYLLG